MGVLCSIIKRRGQRRSRSRGDLSGSQNRSSIREEFERPGQRRSQSRSEPSDSQNRSSISLVPQPHSVVVVNGNGSPSGGETTSVLSTLPFEINELIFELACDGSNGGPTARALSRVSRYVREVSKPFLYLSVDVRGGENITRLEARLAPLPPSLRKIRHLFVADVDWTLPVIKHNYMGRVPPGYAWDPLGTLQNRGNNLDFTQVPLIRLLVLAAPTLQTLALMRTFAWMYSPAIDHALSLDFPKLRDFAFMGASNFQLNRNRLFGKYGRMPRLTHVYVAFDQGGGPWDLYRPEVGLGETCPQITHLWFSELRYASWFAEELCMSLLGRKPSSVNSHMEKRVTYGLQVPDNLRHFVLQLAPIPELGRAQGSNSQLRMLRIFEEVATALAPSRGESGGCTYSFLKPRDSSIHAYDEFMAHWMAAADGDDSRWSESPYSVRRQNDLTPETLANLSRQYSGLTGSDLEQWCMGG